MNSTPANTFITSTTVISAITVTAAAAAVTRAYGMLGDSELCVCVRDCNGCAGHCGEVCGGQAQPSEASVLAGLSLSVIYNSNNNYYYTTVCCCFYFFAALPRFAPTYRKNVC